jgi:hypothetical protein
MDNVVISEHCVPERVFATKGYHERYRKAIDYFNDHPVIATEVAFESDGPMRTTVMEVLSGVWRDENKSSIPADEFLNEQPLTTLATVDGKPFAGKSDSCHIQPGIKTGQRAMTAEEIRSTLRRGDNYVRYAEHGPRFTVPTARAVGLLEKYGYRTAEVRYTARGKPTEKDMWILYEVGGPLEEEVHREYPGQKKKR